MGTSHRPGPLLAGRTAVVTGGGGGIGRAISLGFAAHGAMVIVAEIDDGRARETVDEILADGGRAEPCVGDVAEPGQVKKLVEVAERVGPVDVLVNNVGHFLFRRHDFVEDTEQEWSDLYAINLLHVMRCTHAFLPGMIERRRGGSVVNVSTVEAHRGVPQHSVYGAFKAGVAHFTRCLALEVGRHGIRVNGIAPDLIETLQVPY